MPVYACMCLCVCTHVCIALYVCIVVYVRIYACMSLRESFIEFPDARSSSAFTKQSTHTNRMLKIKGRVDLQLAFGLQLDKI